MRLLVITPRFDESSEGDGFYAFNLSNSLLNEGIAVDVLTIKKNNFVHISISNNNNKRDRIYNYIILGKVNNNLIEQNFYSRSAKKSLDIVLKRINPNIIHIHGIHQYFTISCIQALKRYAIPTIITIHDYKILCGNAGFFSNRTNSICFKCLKGKFLPPIRERCKCGSFIASFGTALQMGIWKYSRAFEYINCFHCGSIFVFNLLKKNREIAPKLRLVRFPYLKNGKIELNKLHGNDPKIVFVGRFVPHKGIIIFAETIRNIKDIKIDIFGNGILFNEAKAMLKKKQNVFFHGWKTHEEIIEYLNIGTIFIAPYLVHETFCYTIIEAMMQGCCVVASDRGAIPELIIDGYNGIIVNNPNSESFKLILKDLLTNKDKIYYLGKNAKEIYNSLNNLAVHTKEILNLYKAVIIDFNRNKKLPIL